MSISSIAGLGANANFAQIRQLKVSGGNATGKDGIPAPSVDTASLRSAVKSLHDIQSSMNENKTGDDAASARPSFMAFIKSIQAFAQSLAGSPDADKFKALGDRAAHAARGMLQDIKDGGTADNAPPVTAAPDTGAAVSATQLKAVDVTA
jgi:hypothetical protein